MRRLSTLFSYHSTPSHAFLSRRCDRPTVQDTRMNDGKSLDCGGGKLSHGILLLLCALIIIMRLIKWITFFLHSNSIELLSTVRETADVQENSFQLSKFLPVDTFTLCLSHPLSGSGLYFRPNGSTLYDRYITQWRQADANGKSSFTGFNWNWMKKFVEENGDIVSSSTVFPYLPFEVLLCGYEENGDCSFVKSMTNISSLVGNRSYPIVATKSFQHCQSIVFKQNVKQIRLLARMDMWDLLVPNDGEIGFHVLFHNQRMDLNDCPISSNSWIFLPVQFRSIVNAEAYQSNDANKGKCDESPIHLASAIFNDLTDKYLYLQEVKYFRSRIDNFHQSRVHISARSLAPLIQLRANLLIVNSSFASVLIRTSHNVYATCQRVMSWRRDQLELFMLTSINMSISSCPLTRETRWNQFIRDINIFNERWMEWIHQLCKTSLDFTHFSLGDLQKEWIQLVIVKMLSVMMNDELREQMATGKNDIRNDEETVDMISGFIIDHIVIGCRNFTRFMSNNPIKWNIPESNPFKADCLMIMQWHRQLTRDLIDFLQEFISWQSLINQMKRENYNDLHHILLKAASFHSQTTNYSKSARQLYSRTNEYAISNLSMMVVQFQKGQTYFRSSPYIAVQGNNDYLLDDFIGTTVSLLIVLFVIRVICPTNKRKELNSQKSHIKNAMTEKYNLPRIATARLQHSSPALSLEGLDRILSGEYSEATTVL